MKKPKEFLNPVLVLFATLGCELVPIPGAAQGSIVLTVTATASSRQGFGYGNCENSSDNFNFTGQFTFNGYSTLADIVEATSTSTVLGEGTVNGTLVVCGVAENSPQPAEMQVYDTTNTWAPGSLSQS